MSVSADVRPGSDHSCGRVERLNGVLGEQSEIFDRQVPVVAGPRIDPSTGIGASLVAKKWRIVAISGPIPSWTKDASGGPRPINAMAETVAFKPMFREANRRRRCVAPIDNVSSAQPMVL